MSRLASTVCGIWAALLVATCSGAAHADVFEIDDQGVVQVRAGAGEVRWSGDVAEVAADEAEPAAETPVVEEQVLTRAGATTIPAAYSARVAELAQRYDVSPALIEALVWQESRWRANAVSPKGAMGLSQLMPGTARQLGVDPSDPHANLEGGARYLRQQLDAFDGDIERALAAYNAGPGRVRRANGVPAITETRRYVGAIIDRLSTTARR